MALSNRRARAAVRRARPEVRGAPVMVRQVTMPDETCFFDRSKFDDGKTFAPPGVAAFDRSRFDTGATFAEEPPDPPTARFGYSWFDRGYKFA